MSASLEAIDRQLLDLLQKEFPLSARPYAALGARIGLAENEICRKVAGWQESGLVRRLGAVFDSKRLGYRSALVAMRVPMERVDEVAAQISRWPGVTHNYLRETADEEPPLDYNLWFTVTAPTEHEIAAILGDIARVTGITEILELPARQLFKIKVEFEVNPGTGEATGGGGANNPRRMARGVNKVASSENQAGLEQAGSSQGAAPSPAPRDLTRQDWLIIEALQEDLEAAPEPFAILADKLGMRQEELLDKIREYLAAGVIRRFGATLKHVEVGFSANAMGVWRVPVEREDEVGQRMAEFRAVSHCYSRITYPKWPYNLYTMIHAKNREECREVARQIAVATGINDYRLLFTARELKKERMRYMSSGTP